MPPFDGTLTDHQIVELAAFVRHRFTDAQPWQGIPQEIEKIRKGEP
jgi:mono/diheme cytochrome c family protein